jgi:hypothetical protein
VFCSAIKRAGGEREGGGKKQRGNEFKIERTKKRKEKKEKTERARRRLRVGEIEKQQEREEVALSLSYLAEQGFTITLRGFEKLPNGKKRKAFLGRKAESFPPVASHFSAFESAGSAGMSLDFIFFFNVCKAVCLVFFSFQNLFSASVLGRSFSILATKLYAYPLFLPCL